MQHPSYFSHLYEIAKQLNQEFSLHAVLRSALEKTIQLLGLQTGWIWLVQEEMKSVYLAASYHLPPALANHPERLSGWCYCIKKYFDNDIESASNISEITCTRLKDITAGTMDLKFHATIPISINGQKIGLLNLLTAQSQQLSEEELGILNAIADLIATAVHRSRSQRHSQSNTEPTAIQRVLNQVIAPRIDTLYQQLLQTQHHFSQKQDQDGQKQLTDILEEAQALQEQLKLILQESHEQVPSRKAEVESIYPISPLTNRELEVINLVKRGYTNKQVAEHLFISERTVKFHMTSLLSKLQAKTRTEAVDIAINRGLIGI